MGTELEGVNNVEKGQEEKLQKQIDELREEISNINNHLNHIRREISTIKRSMKKYSGQMADVLEDFETTSKIEDC